MMMNPVSLILLGKFSIGIIAEKLGIIILQNHLLEGDSVSVFSKDEVTCNEMNRHASCLPCGNVWIAKPSVPMDVCCRSTC